MPINKWAFASSNQEGISQRDYFAVHAPEPPMEWMRLVCNHPNPYTVGGKEQAERIADWKYMVADAMLERSRK